jgi:hypothetical protein
MLLRGSNEGAVGRIGEKKGKRQDIGWKDGKEEHTWKTLA